MEKKIYLTAGLFFLCSFLLFGQRGDPIKVGEEIGLVYESEHPYSASGLSDGETVWKQEINVPGASYIAVHFSKLELKENDYLEISSVDGSRSWKYNYSKNISEGSDNGFWGIPIYGETAIIEIISFGNTGGFGYYIDKIAKGISQLELKSANDDDQEAICGADNSLNAICYQSSEPTVYNRSKAVARLFINGTSLCTGWLIGSEGHIMTNNHCVSNSTTAGNVTVEFMAEGSSCSSNCQTALGCPGTVEATSTTLIQTDVNLDYTLLKLPGNVSSTYGYLQLRESGAVLNEQIYIPQHPAGWGKRIALASDYSGDADGLVHVQSLTEPRCDGTGYDVGYYGDTRGGSSGSPVIAYNDHLVVALHHCAYCPNRGVPIEEIIDDLGTNLPDNSIGSCPDNITITNNLSGGTHSYLASNTITANNVITGGANVHYGANNGVTLNTGFKVSQGSIFKADLSGCLEVKSTEQGKVDEAISLNSGQNDKTISLFPNPASDYVTLIMKNLEDNKKIQVFSATGVLVEEISFTENELYIDTGKLVPGVYIVNVQNGQKEYRKQLVISNK